MDRKQERLGDGGVIEPTVGDVSAQLLQHRKPGRSLHEGIELAHELGKTRGLVEQLAAHTLPLRSVAVADERQLVPAGQTGFADDFGHRLVPCVAPQGIGQLITRIRDHGRAFSQSPAIMRCRPGDVMAGIRGLPLKPLRVAPCQFAQSLLGARRQEQRRQRG